MSWVKLDDQAPRNGKMLRAGPAACWLWVCGIAHSQSQLTNGFVSFEALPMIGITGNARAKRLAETLVAAGLFDRTEGGYQVHDYLDHNPTRASVLARRAEDAARKRVESERNPSGIRAESSVLRARPRGMGWGEGKAFQEREFEGKPVVRGAVSLEPLAPDPIAERAGRLLERYAELFYQHQRGAKYHSRPHLDYPKACQLCETWTDDARLEKLMVLVLTTNDPWITGTDRGFGVFVVKASWADAALAKWEAEQERG